MAGRFAIGTVFKAIDRLTAPVSKMQKSVGKFTKSMERGIRRVNNRLTRMAKSLRAGVMIGITALTGAFTAAGFSIKKVADRADELAKTARIIDMPIEDLQKYQFVAEQSGLSTDEMTKSLEILDKQVGQAKAGTGLLITALKKTDPVLLRQLKTTKNTSQAFNLVIKALKKIKDPMMKAELATGAFGRQGFKLINISKLSAKQLNKLKKEAEANGLITEKQAEAAEAFNDQLNSLKHTFQGIIQDSLLPMMPLLKEYLAITQKWILAHRKLIIGKVKTFFILVGKAIAFLVKHAKAIGIVVAAFLSLMIVLRAFIIVMTAVNLVMDANPIMLVVIAIAGLVAGIIYAIKHWKMFENILLKILDPLHLFIGSIKLLKVVLKSVASFFVAVFNKIKSKIQGIVSFFKRILSPFKKTIDVNAKVTTKKIEPMASRGAGLQMKSGLFNMLSPQLRTAQAINETKTTNTSEVTIKDETGKAEVTKGTLNNGLTLQKSGAF
jgi:hypothetical protein